MLTKTQNVSNNENMDGNLQTEDFNLMCIWINNMQSRIESNKLNQIIKAYKELNGIFFKNKFFYGCFRDSI